VGEPVSVAAASEAVESAESCAELAESFAVVNVSCVVESSEPESIALEDPPEPQAASRGSASWRNLEFICMGDLTFFVEPKWGGVITR
jgi:hypothetical protein